MFLRQCGSEQQQGVFPQDPPIAKGPSTPHGYQVADRLLTLRLLLIRSHEFDTYSEVLGPEYDAATESPCSGPVA